MSDTSQENLEKPEPLIAATWSCEKDYAVDGLPGFEDSSGAKSSPPGGGGVGPPPASNVDRENSTVPLNEMSVGRKFLLRCQGEPVFLDQNSLRLEIPKEAKHSLHLLEVRRLDEKSGDFLMTSYRAGSTNLPKVGLTDGKTRVEIGPFQQVVPSVVQPPEPGKKPEPFGPFGPFQLAWPWYIWAFFVGFALVVLGFIAWRVIVRYRRKKLFQSLDRFKTASTPYNQFNKDFRKIYRDIGFFKFDKSGNGAAGSGATSESMTQKEQISQQVEKLDEVFRLYLIRELKLPALDWSDREVLNEMKNSHWRVFRDQGADVKALMREFERAKKSDTVTLVDCQQLSQLCQSVTTKIYQTAKKSRSAEERS